ncbi:MAG: hypothetical protein ACSHX0_13865 [Akkermansiaceae bacterium]
MNLPHELLTTFSESEELLKQQPWFNSDWTTSSGQWDDPRYSDTVVLKLSKRNWTTTFPITLYQGAEIHYAAWVDEKSYKKKELVFGMHVFSYPMIDSKKARKKDFTDWFRSKHGHTVLSWNHHRISKGPQVPYAGSFKFKAFSDIQFFMLEDFNRFASLAESIDTRLAEIKNMYETAQSGVGNGE